jgi:CBS domain-containing protein
MDTRIRQVIAAKGSDVHSVSNHSPIGEAARKMAELGVGSLLVRSQGHVVGILTERDLARRVCGGDYDPVATPVERVMTSPLAYVTPDATVAEAMKVMADTDCRHLPVYEEGRLVGLVSLGDLVRWITADLAESVRYLEDYIVRG